MRSRKFSYIGHKLKVGLTLRCPNCEQGKLFHGLFKMVAVCPYCQSRFERGSGDAVGGVYINVALAELTSVGGFFVVQRLFHPPIMVQLLIWVPYILLFVVFFYRHARGLWTGVLFITGAVYPDPDYERDYIAPNQVVRGSAPLERE
jgi:uncharacterized protein (DUF983 family)